MGEVMPMPKIVDVEETTVELPRELYVRLQQTAENLSKQLGFSVSVEDAIGWCWKRAEHDFAAYQVEVEKAWRAQQTRSAEPTIVPVGRDFKNDFDATVQIPEGMSVADIDVVRECRKNHAKINAIKHVREKTRLGLKEAKDWVEQHFNWS